MSKTERELVTMQRIMLHKIESYVKANQLDQIGEFFPGFLHFNRKNDLHIQYMNPQGLDRVDMSLLYIQQNGAEFFDRIVHHQSIKEVFPRFIEFYNRNDSGRTYADFQDLSSPLRKDYYQVLTVTKVVKELDGLMSMSLPVNELGPNMLKLKALIRVDSFYETNFERFQSLTNREKEILRLISLGHPNKIIADQLFVSVHTILTHRKRIWKKMLIRGLVDAIRYAEVFGLI